MPDEFKKTRFLELDLLRGLAVIGMIVFHFFFILDFYGVMGNAMFSGWWLVLAQFVRFTFLGLVGVGMAISHERILMRGGNMWRAILRQWERVFIILLCALLVNVATFIYIPENYVRFGILHLISVSIFFWSFFMKWKWPVLILAFVSFWLGGWFGGIVFDGMLPWFKGEALDYFPIFPWTGVVGAGIFLGHVFYSQKSKRTGLRWKTDFWLVRILSAAGKNALLLYMLHVPIIIFVLDWIYF